MSATKAAKSAKRTKLDVQAAGHALAKALIALRGLGAATKAAGPKSAGRASRAPKRAR